MSLPGLTRQSFEQKIPATSAGMTAFAAIVIARLDRAILFHPISSNTGA